MSLHSLLDKKVLHIMVHNVFLCSLQEQLAVKSQLDCKPFQWYIENIFPELKWVSSHLSLSNK